MSTEMDPSERRRIEHKIRAKAYKRVRARLGFYWHLAAYVMLNGALVGINLTQSPGYLWFLWPLAAWTIGLLFHAFATFQGGGMTESMIEAEVSRELARRGMA